MDTLIPVESLPPETLENIVKDIVSRDGTDYGDYDMTSDHKYQQVMAVLRKKEAVLVFDTETETIKLVSKAELQRGF